MRQPVGGLIEFGVGQRLPGEGDRCRFGGGADLLGEHLRDRQPHRRGLAERSPVTPPIEPSVLSVIEHINARQMPARISSHRLKHPTQPRRQN
ncbi:MAG TPA: hypothetical protein PKI24_22640, partial [Nitrospira sp.]|nr:hypothetical protein [Nitrospira sp.]